MLTEDHKEAVAAFLGKMNFIDGTRLGDKAKTVGVRPEHISVDEKQGDWKGVVIHAEHLGADTNLYLDTEKAGRITVRLFGEFQAEPGAVLYATPMQGRVYRFDENGQALQ